MTSATQATVKYPIRQTAFLLLAAATLSSCSYYSKSASDQRNYDRYVKQHTGIQYKMKKQNRPKPAKLQAPPPMQPQIAAGASAPPSTESPQAAASSEGENQ